MKSASIPRTCPRCPHFDEFHSNCSHPSSQAIIRDLSAGVETCPVYSEGEA